MPREGAVGPAELKVDLPQHFTEGEYAIKALQIKALKLLRRGDRALAVVTVGRDLESLRAEAEREALQIP